MERMGLCFCDFYRGCSSCSTATFYLREWGLEMGLVCEGFGFSEDKGCFLVCLLLVS